ncbi:MFS transporter [Halomarina halobia]|uniref:MFS transporter n=1 Tax=Halomarina halobia TaxID=3033386 RepID=A0ABD6AE65_9EURY|nr:MFS transporter [Halomarina sp. PSR21]
MHSDWRRVLADRVYYGWVIVFASLLASMAVFGTSYAFGVFYDAFAGAFDVSRSLLAGVFGLQTALLYVVGVRAGQYVDRYGQRRVGAVSGLLFSAGLVWTALARSYLEVLAAFGVVTAVGMSGLFVISFATAPRWFYRRRGAATGIASSGLGVGLLVFPWGADVLIASFGWRVAMGTLAAVVAAISVIVVALFVDDPAAVGEEFEDATRRSVNDADEGSDRPPGSARDVPASNRIPPEVTTRRFVLVFSGWVLLSAPVYVLVSYVVLFATDAGFGRAAGVASITLVGLTSTIARFGIGSVSDRVGRTRTFVTCGVLMGAVICLIAGAPDATALFALVAVYGVGYGGFSGLFSALVADLFGSSNLNTLFPLMSLAFAVSGLVAPPLAGFGFELLGNYDPVFVAFGGGALVGSGFVALAGRIGERRHLGRDDAPG